MDQQATPEQQRPVLNQFSLLFKPSSSEREVREFIHTQPPATMNEPNGWQFEPRKERKERRVPPRRRIILNDAPVQIQGTTGYIYDSDLPRQKIFEGEHYQYSQNPFNHLATATWGSDAWQEAQNDQR